MGTAAQAREAAVHISSFGNGQVMHDRRMFSTLS